MSAQGTTQWCKKKIMAQELGSEPDTKIYDTKPRYRKEQKITATSD